MAVLRMDGGYRLTVLSRACAAIFGGYALASACAACLAVMLPIARSQAVLTGMLLAIVACACAALWAFAARTAWGAWLGILTPTATLLLAMATWMHWR